MKEINIMIKFKRHMLIHNTELVTPVGRVSINPDKTFIIWKIKGSHLSLNNNVFTLSGTVYIIVGNRGGMQYTTGE